ncbi:accessory protein regulator protein B [Peptoanaerobacter stomatis]|uniref:Accessory protein regulator protein B n=1 Tax=Peptoanaerobacter stomatis TaxID=796937 RepID=J5WD05_9FIRM|nr:accessory gene regulator B family protein [Peptoanaerobacter stomatis]EJU21052.1 accessory protein regulator protein B [Peptoanaerobacter stomatis]NWO25401.1 accessory gene regulator B family protein [Peptostreptococcaceae bacterium oral taxon 081]
MSGSFIEKIVCFLKKEGIIESDKEQIYFFGIKQAAFLLINLIITLSIAIIFEKKIELLIFILQFISLRSFSGGYHSKSKITCTIISSAAQIIALFLLGIVYLDIKFVIIATIVFSILIILFSPIESSNKPLDKLERKIYKRITTFILFVFIAISIFSYFFYNTDTVAGITLINTGIVLILQLICVIKHKIVFVTGIVLSILSIFS